MQRFILSALLFGLAVTGLVLGGPALADDLEPRPGYQKPLDKAHPAWRVKQARPGDFEPQVGCLAFSPDGKYMALCTFNPKRTGPNASPNGTLYIVENFDAEDTSKIKLHKVSEDLTLPLGAQWLDDGLFILDRYELSKWNDNDGDGMPEQKKTFASGWISDNFHHFSFGLGYHDGYFYGALSTSLHLSQEERDTIKPNLKDPIAGRVSNSKGKTLGGNAPNPPHRGNVMKVDAKTGEVEWIAGGLRTPNGVGIGPEGIVLVPDNQGDWKPTDAIYVADGGEFFGKYNSTASHINLPDGGVPSLNHEKDPTPPAIWLPHNEIGNSPSATLLIPEGKPFAGQVLSADLTQGAIHRVFMEKVDGTWQGAVFRHTMGLEGGPNDIKWGPDGNLYVGAMGSGGVGGWGWGKTLFGLQRLEPTGKTAFEYEKIEATKDGFRVTFTQPASNAIADPANWRVNTYTYEAQPFYGGPKVPREYDQQVVAVKSAKVASDAKSVELILAEDRKPNHVYHIRTDAKSAEGQPMWSPEAWVTFHKAPTQ